MRIPRHPTLLRRLRDARVRELAVRCPPLAASIGRQTGGGCHVTLKHRGKTRTVYIPKDLMEEVKASIREHRRIKRLLAEITLLQLALIRAYRREQVRLTGRGGIENLRLF